MTNEVANQILNVLMSISENLMTPWYLNWSFWNTFVLFITLVILVVYTWHTAGIHKENKRLRESASMPFLYMIGNDFELAEQPNNVSLKGTIQIINIGKGPAIDIEIDDIKVGYCTIKFKRRPKLIPQRLAYDKMRDMPETIHSSGIAKSDVPIKNPMKKMTIICKDQLGKKHVFEFNISSCEFISHKW